MPRSNPQITRRSHYIQRRLLARWEVEPGRRVHYLHRGRGTLGAARAKRIAREADCFYVDHPDLEPDAVEDVFTEIEEVGFPILARIAAGEVRSLAETDRTAAAHYFAMALTRSLGWRRENARRARATVPEFVEEFHQKWGWAGVSKEWIEAKARANVESYIGVNFIRHHRRMVDIILKMEWTLVVALPGSEFIVGDRYGVVVDSQEIGTNGGMGRVAHFLPLSPSAMVALNITPDSVRASSAEGKQPPSNADLEHLGHADDPMARDLAVLYAGPRTVNDLNYSAAAQAEEHVFGRRPEVLTNIHRGLEGMREERRAHYRYGKPMVGSVFVPRLVPSTGDVLRAASG